MASIFDLAKEDLDTEEKETKKKSIFNFEEEPEEQSEVYTNMDQQNVDTDLVQDEEEEPNIEEKTPEKEPSFWQNVADNPLTQSILGVAKRVTYPLDMLKMMVMGEGFSGLEELEAAAKKEGIPFDREKYIETVFDIGSKVPTQQMGEDLVKEKTGVDLAPKDTFSKIIRTGSEIASTGPSGLLKQPAKEIGKQVLKRTAGGLAGATAGEGLKKVGVPEPLADMLSYMIGGAAGGSKEAATLNKGQAKNLAVAEEHGLRKFGGMQREKPLKNAIVHPEAQAKAAQELGDTSQKAIQNLIDKKIPATKYRKMGVDLKDAYTKAYGKADKTANNLTKSGLEVDMQPVLDKITDKINKIKGSAPSLSTSDKNILKELNRQKKALSERVGPKSQKRRIGKQIPAEQAVEQIKKFNKETKGIYKKSEFSGHEQEIINMYGELKDDLIESIGSTSPELKDELKFANKIFHQKATLDRVEEMVGKAFEDGYDPKKLNQILGGKRNRAFLERDLGKDAVKQMQDIAKYGMDAEKQAIKAVKNPKTILEYANESPLKLSLLFKVGRHGLASQLGPYGLGASIGYDLSKHAINRAKGYLMLRPKTRQSYSDFLKHSISPESPAFKKASKELTKSIEDEYGSEKEFIEMINDEEDEE